MWYSVGQLFCIMATFKCALYKNNYATPRLADVRFHVYATRTIKRPFAAQIIADAPMHSLYLFFPSLPPSSLSLSLSISPRSLPPISISFPLSLCRCALLWAAPPSNFRLRFNIGGRLIRDDGFSGISSLYYKKASPGWTADVTCAFFCWPPCEPLPPLNQPCRNAFVRFEFSLKCVRGPFRVTVKTTNSTIRYCDS